MEVAATTPPGSENQMPVSPSPAPGVNDMAKGTESAPPSETEARQVSQPPASPENTGKNVDVYAWITRPLDFSCELKQPHR